METRQQSQGAGKRFGVVLMLIGAAAAVWIVVGRDRDTGLSQGGVLAGRVGSDAAVLIVGTNVWPGYEPLYLADGLGHYDEARIHFVEYSSATQVLRAFQNGIIQVAALTLDEVMMVRQHGHEAKVILVTDISNGADVVLGAPTIRRLEDVKGRWVGVENTALGGYMLTRALQSVGLTTDDVQVVPLEINEHERAFTHGEIQAVVTFDPVRSRLLAQGANELFNSAQIPDEIVDVLVVRPATIAEQSAQLGWLLQGWFRALDYLRQNPSDAAERMSARLNLTPEEVLASYGGMELPSLARNNELLSGSPSRLELLGEKLAGVMVAEGLLATKPELRGLCAPLVEGLNGEDDR